MKKNPIIILWLLSLGIGSLMLSIGYSVSKLYPSSPIEVSIVDEAIRLSAIILGITSMVALAAAFVSLPTLLVLLMINRFTKARSRFINTLSLIVAHLICALLTAGSLFFLNPDSKELLKNVSLVFSSVTAILWAVYFIRNAQAKDNKRV